jgi:hypothetical protein
VLNGYPFLALPHSVPEGKHSTLSPYLTKVCIDAFYQVEGIPSISGILKSLCRIDAQFYQFFVCVLFLTVLGTTRQALCHLSHSSSPFLCWIFLR